MKKVGKVLHYTRNGNLVASTDRMIRENTVVYFKRERELGTVIETFGPVTDPYLLIKPAILNAKINDEVYVER